MGKHDGNIRGFHIHSESWYGQDSKLVKGIVDLVEVGWYDPDGCGTSGEFGVEWHNIGGTPTPAVGHGSISVDPAVAGKVGCRNDAR